MAKETFWFRHDSDAADDDKTMLLIEQLGMEGYGIYWVLIEKLRTRTDYKMPFSVIPSLARRYMTTTEKMKTVITQYGLFEFDEEGFFYSISLINRMQKFNELKEKRAEAGRIGMSKRWEKKDNNVITELYQSNNNVITSDNTEITSYNDKNRIEENIIEYKEKEEYKYSSQKNEGIEEEIKTWRESFDEYLKLVYEAQAKLLNDVEFKKQKELYHANLDYELSLEKMVKEYWATDTGWGQKKKNKKVKNIDMVTTLKKAFDLSCNRVYKQINTRQKQNVVEPTKTPDNPFYTVVPLNSKLKFIDKRGTLNDGTFVEDGYRYYLSQKDGMKYSIPPKAEPMPHQDCEYDMKSNKWYEPKQVQNSDGLFLF